MNEGSRVESDVESTTGSSLTSTTHEESLMWAHTSEEEIECIQDSNQMLYIPTSQIAITLPTVTKPSADTSDISTYFQDISLPALNVLPNMVIDHLNQSQHSNQQEQQPPPQEQQQQEQQQQEQQQQQTNSNYIQQILSSDINGDHTNYENDCIIEENDDTHLDLSASIESAAERFENVIETIDFDDEDDCDGDQALDTADKCLNSIVIMSSEIIKPSVAQNENFDQHQQQLLQQPPIVKVLNGKIKRKRSSSEKQSDSVLHTNKVRCRILNCSTCGVDARITKAHLNVLRAQKQKLREEIKILKLKKRALANAAGPM